ncbi:MAG TPA: sulfatase-like hydrolase/transferase [Thermoanaerobaculia bacterium]|nr:sulfatase-like hydrolase/transferase [Thermoanaerobaculia bacterium]
MRRVWFFLPLIAMACGQRETLQPPPAVRPSILLVTLDTTRADAMGADTPAFNALAARGRRFTQAYATVPQTLPSHTSMLTGMYPAGHGIHENARYVAASHPLASEQLRNAGYRTGAFVSAFPLARRFGLARGFDTYDDELPARAQERSANDTNARALAWLARQNGPVFRWVHYFEPHAPYEPPQELRARYAGNAYQGEVAAMDQQLGRLLQAFQQRDPNGAIVVVADHGEGLGDHGEIQHGNLVYQSTMHVPLVVAGPGIAAGVEHAPVSTRRVFHTLLDFAGIASEHSLRTPGNEVVVGESMIPFLQFGWQPQVMAIEGPQKTINAGRIEVYDVVADPRETRDLAKNAELSRGVRQALREYPIPSPATTAGPVSDEDRRQLAALGYIASEVKPVIRPDAPRPADMTHLFEPLERASALFVAEQYRAAIPLLEQIVAEDPNNLMTTVRLAVTHSALGNNDAALQAFRKAQALAPASPDVRHYLAMHYAKSGDIANAAPLLEQVVAESPDRLPALEALADVRERQNRLGDALTLRQKIHSMKAPSPAELAHLGVLAMELGQTPVALDAFEKARAQQGAAFQHHLELGVLYLDARRYAEARDALDRVPPAHPAYPMALFKRAQVSVLLNEPDRVSRIAAARVRADETTRVLIERERLFQ